MAYTKAELLDIVHRFEKCAEKQAFVKGSTVKQRSAERDLLVATEAVRDLCIMAVKGNKELLAEVFGGDCEGIGRMFASMETVELSEMHAGDQRWAGCREQLDIIKAILMDLGSFRPWKLGLSPPSSVTYGQVALRFSPGERVSLQPELEGSNATYFTCSPQLPEGLHFNKMTGAISGILKPGIEVESKTYVIKAGNNYGETEATLTFSVKVPPPESVEYPGISDLPFVGERAEYSPQVIGGIPQEWWSEPELPAGCELDWYDGTLKITPTVALEPLDYIITALNSGGGAKVTVQIGAKEPPPVSLSYPSAKGEYPFNAVLYLLPELKMATSGRATLVETNVVRGMTFSVSPAFPEGLELAPQSGSISGKPMKPIDKTTYQISATNAGGQVSFDLQLEFKNVPPSELWYDPAVAYTCGEPISLSPCVQGIVSEWIVEPALPIGLTFDNEMGMVFGTPTEETTCDVWVTARNDAGEVSFELWFEIKRAPPSNLSYPGAETLYALYRLVTMDPIVEGIVDSFSVTPALPPGLAIDAASGTISGTPTETAELTRYEVTAKNESGIAKTQLSFSVQIMPPTNLRYPQIDEVYEYGEEVWLEPEVEGGATQWTIEPTLPTGMFLDGVTGAISGAPATTAEQASYVITASNEAGGTSTIISFMVLAPAPDGLAYPTAAADYRVGTDVVIDPELLSAVCGLFTVEPPLPPGLQIDSKTGVIRGKPSSASELAAYTVTIRNIAGSDSTELSFSISAVPDSLEFEPMFANIVERTMDLAELKKLDPSQSRHAGDWMIWMVHRAWLNDPDLTVFDFDNLQMPMPHVEPRVAPKLMKALAFNTNIVQLFLQNSNLQKPQGLQLAESLRANSTLQVLNIESNNLDCNAIETIAVALKESPTTVLQQWRFDNQKGVGACFGRRVEEAIAQMMEENKTIVKLGVSMNDPHWRRQIGMLLTRNNDVFRRNRKRARGIRTRAYSEEVAAVDKALSKVMLKTAPAVAAWELFNEEDEKATLVRGCMASLKRFPTKEQLQAFAKNAGATLKFSEVATVLKDFRFKMLNAFVEGPVMVFDTSLTPTEGTLAAWNELNDKWMLDIFQDALTRFAYKSDKQPIFELSDEVAFWVAVKR